MSASPETLAALRRRVAVLEGGATAAAGRFTLGCDAVDDALGGLSRGAVHEVYAKTGADGPSALAFAGLLGLRAAPRRMAVWVVHDRVAAECGDLYAPGLVELGVGPDRIVLVRARDAPALLKAALEALRCGGLACVIATAWGDARVIDITAERRLLLAAQASRTPLFLVRAGVQPSASPAETRWSVAAAPSIALEAGAPGRPAFSIDLLRRRSGPSGRAWTLEWDRDRGVFDEAAPLSRGLVSALADGQGAAVTADGRRAA